MAIQKCEPNAFLEGSRVDCNPVEGVEGNGMYIIDAYGDGYCVAKEPVTELKVIRSSVHTIYGVKSVMGAPKKINIDN